MGTPSHSLSFEVVYSLVLESLAQVQAGQLGDLVEDVGSLAVSKKLVPPPPHTGAFVAGQSSIQHLPHALQDAIAEAVRQAMWRCALRGLIVPGRDSMNPNFPHFQVTHHGRTALASKTPQPYDPDRFIEYFKKTNPSADAVVLDYFEEAVATFNASSTKASAVMLGAASEKLILVLIDQLGLAIKDPGKQATYQADLEKNWTVSHKWNVLRSTLEKVMVAKKTPFPKDIAETIKSDLPMVFDLLRRIRNVAGHPEVPGRVDVDGVFLNLRVFPDYVRRVSELLDHLATNNVDW